MKKFLFIISSILFLQTKSFCQSWDAMADVPVGLTFPVVVELNGEIHVIGGGAAAGATDIHLRYKPATNSWDTLAPVPYLAQQPSGAVVAGKIHYFGGGFPNSGTPLNKHYMYDPVSNTWDSAAFLSQPRVIMEAATLNGKIYAMSGQPDKTLMEEYDPTLDSWTTKNPLPDQNFWYSSIQVVNGEMYRFGGGGYISPVDYVSKYNSSTDSWSNIATLPIPIHALAGAPHNHYAVLAGGYHSFSDIDSVWLYDVNTQIFYPGFSLPEARAYHDMVTIDSCVYSIGGDNTSFPSVKTQLLRYCPALNVSAPAIAIEKGVQVFYSAESVSIKILSPLHNKNVAVELFDLTGRKVFSENKIPDLNNTIGLNTSQLTQSFYILRLKVDEQFYSVKVPVENIY